MKELYAENHKTLIKGMDNDSKNGKIFCFWIERVDNLEMAILRVPTKEQWVKNPTTATRVIAEAQTDPCLAQWIEGSGAATAAVWIAAEGWSQSLVWELPYALDVA